MKTLTVKILGVLVVLLLCACQRQVSAIFCPAVPLSPEVKSFIDSAIAHPSDSNQIAMLQRQMAELEGKINELQKTNNALQAVRGLHDRNCTAADSAIHSFDEKLHVIRQKEAGRLRLEILQSCLDAGASRTRSRGSKSP